MRHNLKPLCRKYNDIADYHTLEELLSTRGIDNINFYEFYQNNDVVISNSFKHLFKMSIQFLMKLDNK